MELGLNETWDAMRSVNASFAGTGLDATTAAAFTLLPCAKVRTALVALASGGVDATIAARAKAEDDRSGINMLTLTEDNKPNSTDMERVLGAVRAARLAVGPKGVVLFSHHNHLVTWNQTFTPLYRLRDPIASQPPAWLYPFVESVLEAGASAYLGHGNPLFQGFAVVQGKPVFYSLGNFIFHVTISNDATYGPIAFEGIAADMRLGHGNTLHIRVKTLKLGLNRSVDDFGLPHIPTAEEQQMILARFLNLSAGYGTQFVVDSTKTEATLVLKFDDHKQPKAPSKKKAGKANVAIGVGAVVLLLVGGVGFRRRQLSRANQKAAATPLPAPQQVVMRV
jgi:poly-gamma-glutamate synthesis protein (capsule biosynthesis protein)